MFESKIPLEIKEQTLYFVDNIKQDKDVTESLNFLQENYSGIFKDNLNKYKLNDIDKDEFLGSEQRILYDAAKSFDSSKNSLFSAHFFRKSSYYARELTKKSRKHENTESLETISPSVQFSHPLPDHRNKCLLKDVETIIDNFVKKENEPPQISLIIKSRLLFNLKFNEIPELIKKQFNLKYSEQRCEQIEKIYLKKIKKLLNRELGLKYE